MTAPPSRRRDPTIRLHDRLATLSDAPPSTDQADAAVLILLGSGTKGLEVLAEQRADRPGDPWSGQVGLPGGHTEPGDRSLTETVLRELREEVGIRASDLDGPPKLFDTRRARPSGLRVAVFVGSLQKSVESFGVLNPTEVATTFWLPLDALDHIESRPRTTAMGEIYVDTVVYEGHVVWGFTLRVLQDFVAWVALSEESGTIGPQGLHRGRSQAL